MADRDKCPKCHRPVAPKPPEGMIEQWDDRAIQVVPNTGMTLQDHLTVQVGAARNQKFERG